MFCVLWPLSCRCGPPLSLSVQLFSQFSPSIYAVSISRSCSECYSIHRTQHPACLLRFCLCVILDAICLQTFVISLCFVAPILRPLCLLIVNTGGLKEDAKIRWSRYPRRCKTNWTNENSVIKAFTELRPDSAVGAQRWQQFISKIANKNKGQPLIEVFTELHPNIISGHKLAPAT